MSAAAADSSLRNVRGRGRGGAAAQSDRSLQVHSPESPRSRGPPRRAAYAAKGAWPGAPTGDLWDAEALFDDGDDDFGELPVGDAFE